MNFEADANITFVIFLTTLASVDVLHLFLLNLLSYQLELTLKETY